MNKITVGFLSILILSGCGNIKTKVSEEQAKQIVFEHHTKHIGEVEIISVTSKSNKYIIEWENKENCEKGKDSVDKNREIKMIEFSIC